ncbi:GntR family transcriptional regulator [Roseibium sp. AS2]|uniref:GntR family transcriptional regulator n=1 Tax=Roseibium sp. AS2 TaxID=3135781 RepID=UPI0031736F0B
MSISLVADRGSHPEGIKSGKRARKSDAVYQDLKRQILTGEMTSESPITEQALAQEYGCSQSTIREALMLLQEYGLVVRRGYQGTFVTDPSWTEARLMLKLRVSIESTGVAEAVKFITDNELEQLHELDNQFEFCRKQRDVFGCASVDIKFHLRLFEIARMPVLEPMLVRTFMILQRILLSTPRPDASWARPSVTPHLIMLDALAERDTEAALAALRSHILSSAILLAPQYYGTDMQRLLDQVETNFVAPADLAGH